MAAIRKSEPAGHLLALTIVLSLLISIVGGQIGARVPAGDTVTYGCASHPAAADTDSSIYLATSNIAESPEFSVNRGFTADRIVDHNANTLAAPGNWYFDYQIALLGRREVKSLTLYWGEFGQRSLYISGWLLDGCNDKGRWVTLGRGGFPNAVKTTIAVYQSVSELRIRAWSKRNSIGLYEVEVQ